jgi:hypothetical protein
MLVDGISLNVQPKSWKLTLESSSAVAQEVALTKSTASVDHAADLKVSRVLFISVNTSAPKQEISAEVCSLSIGPIEGSECYRSVHNSVWLEYLTNFYVAVMRDPN